MLVRALVFDFDGLICDTEGAQVEAARDVFADHGAELPLDRWLDVIGRSVPEDFWVPWLRERSTRHVDAEGALASFRERNRQRVAALRPNPGIVDLLDSADGLGVPCAIASSSPTRWVHPLLDRLGLRHRFREVVCREHVRDAKPAPDLYVEALRRLGLGRAAASTVALEDSHHGSHAAKQAGMVCVAVPNPLTSQQDFDHVDHVVGSVAAVRLRRSDSETDAAMLEVAVESSCPT